MDPACFIGTTEPSYVANLYGDFPWAPKLFTTPPFPIISMPPNYLFTMGSACPISMATTSIYNLNPYNAAFDLIRQDYLNNHIVFDVDHYIAVPHASWYSIFKEPPTNYHHLKLDDKFIESIPIIWRPYIEKTLGKKV